MDAAGPKAWRQRSGGISPTNLRTIMGKAALYLIVPFCSLFIIVGAGMVLSSARKIQAGIQARDWPHTTGQMLSIQSKDTSDSESESREIQVRYAYQVGGRSYEGTTIHPAYGSSSIEEAHKGLESLLGKSKEVRVYYDRSCPERSSLSVGFFSGSARSFSLPGLASC